MSVQVKTDAAKTKVKWGYPLKGRGSRTFSGVWLDGKSNRLIGTFPNPLPKEREESELSGMGTDLKKDG